MGGLRTKVCARCEEQFTPKYNFNRAKYCSLQCSRDAQLERAEKGYPSEGELRTLHHDQSKTVEEIARIFGRSGYWVRQAMSVRGVAVVYNRGLAEDQECLTCGKVFPVWPSYRMRGRKYCSVACKGEAMHGGPLDAGTREKHSRRRKKHAVRGYSPRRFSLSVKGEDACRNCGAAKNLHLHHIIPRSMYSGGRNEIRNGVPLCAGCHMGWHHRTVELKRSIFHEDEWEYISGVNLLGQNTMAWLDDRYPA